MLELSPHGGPRRAPRSMLLSLLTAVVLVAGTLFALGVAPPLAHAAPAGTAVTTFKNDVERDGDFTNETILNQSNVNVTQFGKRVQYSVDGQVYAEPLFLPNLSVGGGTHNVVFVATENDSVYAFDADATSAIAPLWKVSLLPAGATAVSSNVTGCGDLTPEIGITSTPVIDPGTDTLNSKTNRQRVNLLLENGKIYVGFSSFCDIGTYQGWILAYSYSTTAFTLANVYDDDPNGSDGGLWSGSG